MKFILTITALVILLLPGFAQNNPNFNKNHPNVHKIKVEEVLQTTSYTYLYVEENDSLQWLAIPKMEAKKGDTYYYQGGMEMKDFKSKELNRTFASVLFLNGVISPDFAEGGKTSLNMSPQKSKTIDKKINMKVEQAKGGITIAELYNNKEKYENKTVKIRGRVTKYNSRIMGKNWIHLQDGTSSSGNFDFTATSVDETKTGDIITIEGKIVLNKDFGSGYFFEIIMEDSRIEQ
ncbi:MAG: OB-fold nucleic acid binding domain-containing protein [Draconibacterium sp.]|nr:OB-fold nucleic acid binding domain-containing protein [Draconibacterium sp.]